MVTTHELEVFDKAISNMNEQTNTPTEFSIQKKETQSFVPGVTQAEFDKMPRSHRRRLWRAYLKDLKWKEDTKEKGTGRSEERSKYRLRSRTMRLKYRGGKVIFKKEQSYEKAGMFINSLVEKLKEKYPEAMKTKQEKFNERLKEIIDTDEENIPELILPSKDGDAVLM